MIKYDNCMKKWKFYYAGSSNIFNITLLEPLSLDISIDVECNIYSIPLIHKKHFVLRVHKESHSLFSNAIFE